MPVTFRLLHHLPDFLDAAGDGGEVDEMALGLMGDNLRERGFPHARQPPEIMEDTKSPSIMRRRTLPLPIKCSCPANSSRFCGRRRSASGAGGFAAVRKVSCGIAHHFPLGFLC